MACMKALKGTLDDSTSEVEVCGSWGACAGHLLFIRITGSMFSILVPESLSSGLGVFCENLSVVLKDTMRLLR